MDKSTANYKTVFVLDRSSKFLQSSNEQYEFDVASKSKSTSYIPLAPLNKTHWTCSIEAGLEFCRIVYDIFGRSKLISFIASDIEAHFLTGWSESDQELEKIQSKFGCLGLPRKSSKYEDQSSIMVGLNAALDQLLTLTKKQTDLRFSLMEDADQLNNSGQIVCVTMCKNDREVNEIIREFSQTLNEKNDNACNSDEMSSLTSCKLFLVVVHPVDSTSSVTEKESQKISDNLEVSVVVTRSGKSLANKLVSLAVHFYNLVITAVTGIPMKEEQNANSSASYDVELLHSSEAHAELLTELADGNKAPSQEIEGVDSVTLKWCTPKSSSSNDMQLCVGTYPISPVDANSRPSLCLTNFLLGGRSVMLEQPRKSGSKILSHMLTSTGGQIYIHLLSTRKSILDDPPSISEGVGGRITDYRIQAFGDLMKSCLLSPSPSDSVLSNNAAESKLDRMTRVWPLTIGETMIFNLQSHIEPLLDCIVKESLTEQDINECRQVIFQLMRLEEQNLLSSYSSHKAKKKDEYSRQMWSELEDLIQSHANTSPGHAKVLDLLSHCKPSLSDSINSKRKKSSQSVGSTDSRDGLSNAANDDYNSRSMDDSSRFMTKYDSPVPFKKSKSAGHPYSFKGNQSLLSLWTSRLNAVNKSRHEEFTGRSGTTSSKAVLYKKLNEDLMEPMDEKTPMVKSCPDH